MFEYTYSENLKKIVIAFGSLFNNIDVRHKNNDGTLKEIRVPLAYASQEKFIQRYLNPSSITEGTRIENQLPRMSYIISGIAPDSSRKRGRLNPYSPVDGSSGTCVPSGYQVANEIPININFNLYIYTRHTDDTMQIVEQIMPYFVPDHIIKIDFNEVIKNVNIPITMGPNNLSERFDGDFSTRRINIASFSFVAKAYIFGKLVPTTTYSGLSASIEGLGATFGIIDEY
jgi:hypothetical protein